LDHGFVRLVDHMGSDLSIVRAARVSHDADWRAGNDTGSDARLIRYLWEHRHSTPFEAVEFQFEVKAPIFVLRQWHRHRTHSYNEVSARYTEVPEEIYIPDPRMVGRQSKKNKQARDLEEGDVETARVMATMMRKHGGASFQLYYYLLKQGMPRELARSVLPLGTYSRMFDKVDLWNLFKFIELRGESGAQYEIRVYAAAMLKLIEPIVPVAVATFCENQRVIPT
jgi:thymidylate synthase (FAD)